MVEKGNHRELHFNRQTKMALQNGGFESDIVNNVPLHQIKPSIIFSLRQNQTEIAQSPGKVTTANFKLSSTCSSDLTKDVSKVSNARSNKQSIFRYQRRRSSSANINKEGTDVKKK